MDTAKRRRDLIFELNKKIEFLKENQIAHAVIDHSGSLNSLAEKAEIAWKTFHDGLRAEALSSSCQEKLAKACGFSLNWPEWNDPFVNRNTPRDKRRDTAEAFSQRYLREHALNASGEKCKLRQTDVTLKTVRQYRPAYCDDQLATVELQACQSGPGEPWPLSADLICNPSVIAGVEIAVKRGRLKLDCGAARPDTKSNIAYPDGHVIERPTGNVKLTLGGTSQLPTWEIQAEGGAIGIVSLPFDFCMVYDLAPGDVVGARFLVYLMDLEEVEGGDFCEDEEDVPEADSLSFLRVGFKKLGSAKRKILKRIAEMQLPGGETGLAVLATDELRFERINAEAQEKSNVC